MVDIYSKKSERKFFLNQSGSFWKCSDTDTNFNRFPALYEKTQYMDCRTGGCERIDIDTCSEETFLRTVKYIIPGIDFESVAIEKDYPYGAKVVVDIFEKYLQPKIKEELGRKTRRFMYGAWEGATE